MSSHELLDAADALYRAVLEGPQRDRVPEVIGDLMNADMTGLWCFSTDSRHAYGHQYGNPAAFRDYLTNWAGRDTVIHDVVTTHRGTTATMEGVLKQRPSLCRVPAFEGFYEHHDFVNAAGHFRLISPGWIGGVAALRGRRPGPFRRREKAHLDRLGPHIASALALAVQLDTLKVRETGVERLLTDLGLAMIACTPEGRVLDLTAHAERALRTAAPGIRIRNGHIRGVDHGIEARLRAALGDAGRGHYPPNEFALQNGDGQRIWCTVLPLPRENETVAGTPHDCLVMLQAPGDRVPIRAEQVARSLRVSASEGDVLAGLMRGEDVEAIARRRCGSVETVRSYEKSMRAKLGCHSRAELVARAWSTISTVPAPPPPTVSWGCGVSTHRLPTVASLQPRFERLLQYTTCCAKPYSMGNKARPSAIRTARPLERAPRHPTGAVARITNSSDLAGTRGRGPRWIRTIQSRRTPTAPC